MRILLATVLIGLCLPAAAQDEGPARPPQKRAQQQRAARKPAYPRSHLGLLQARMPLVAFEETPLREVFEWFKDETGANVVVHWNRLADAGIEEARPISLRVRNLRVSQILWLVMNQAAGDETKLAYRASPDMIVISTAAEFEEDLITTTYDIRDLIIREAKNPRYFFGRRTDQVVSVVPIVANGAASVQPVINRIDSGVRGNFSGEGWNQNNNDDDDRETPEQRAGRLIDAIVNSIEPESWQLNGGRGTIRFYDGRLVVRNTPLVHQKLGGALRAP